MAEPLTSEELFKRKIAEGTIDREDATDALEFIALYKARKQLTRGSLSKYYYVLGAVLTELKSRGKKLSTLKEQDALGIFEWLQTSPYTEYTRSDYWDRFTRVYAGIAKRKGSKWDKAAKDLLIGEDKLVYQKNRNRIETRTIFTPEELISVVHTEPNLCYKVFYMSLFEGGMRPGEALAVRLGDVKKVEDDSKKCIGYTLNLPKSKTFKRPVHLVSYSVPYMHKWLSMHPDKNNPDAPLFVNSFGHPLRNETANAHFKYIAKMAGIQGKTKLSLYTLRHSRATEVANLGLSELQMEKMMGWRPGSRMPQTYVRMENIDVRKALLRATGKETEEQKPVPPGKGCLHCQHLNPYGAEYCDNCSLPLDATRLQSIKAEGDVARMRASLKEYVLEELRPVVEQLRNEYLESVKKTFEKKTP